MDSNVLLEHREILKHDINSYNYIIGKEKNKLIQINNFINDNLLILANYVIEHLAYDSFDPHYAYKKIEAIKRLRLEKSVIERSISYKTKEREKLYENYKGINNLLCLR